MKKKIYVFDCERCVMCGKEIPEGRQVCPECESRVLSNECERKNSAPASLPNRFLKRIFKRQRKGE